MRRYIKLVHTCAVFLTCTVLHASTMTNLAGHFIVEGGAYTTRIGQPQHVSIESLIGDDFSVSRRYDAAPVFGVGYLAQVMQTSHATVDAGVEAFYLAKTQVSGFITQENLYTNLAYSYYVSHLPIYALAKASLRTASDNYLITAELGVGPNFMSTGPYNDRSIDGGVTLPDHALTNQTVTVLSVVAGIGLKLNQAGRFPLEVGYRYYYLGEGYLKPANPQVLSNLKTGNISTQALTLTFSL